MKNQDHDHGKYKQPQNNSMNLKSNKLKLN